MWYLDSGCSKHMTGEASQLINLKWKSAGFVTYGDNNRGRILGVGDIGSGNKVIIKDVLLVEGLKHSLLSISQLCDRGYKITFEPEQCIIADSESTETVLVGKRESIEITADDDEPVIQKIVTDQLGKSIEDNQSDEAQSIEPQPIESGTGAAATSTKLPREWRVPRNLSLDNIIGQVQKGVSTRRSMNHFCEQPLCHKLNPRQWVKLLKTATGLMLCTRN